MIEFTEMIKIPVAMCLQGRKIQQVPHKEDKIYPSVSQEGQNPSQYITRTKATQYL